ncbi:hypothetical protein RND81_04G149900 [Saponaria officinalis]|uniref:Secreted protein n=1 Tax=Saponaria officinalis TaxID=3572 RepID=A0AAW1LPS7_SAPOF
MIMFITKLLLLITLNCHVNNGNLIDVLFHAAFAPVVEDDFDTGSTKSVVWDRQNCGAALCTLLVVLDDS